MFPLTPTSDDDKLHTPCGKNRREGIKKYRSRREQQVRKELRKQQLAAPARGSGSIPAMIVVDLVNTITTKCLDIPAPPPPRRPDAHNSVRMVQIEDMEDIQPPTAFNWRVPGAR